MNCDKVLIQNCYPSIMDTNTAGSCAGDPEQESIDV